METLSESTHGRSYGRVTDPWALALISLPGFVGVSLGAIYALGALQTIIQVGAAGLDPIDLFPLIPLNQILGRGIVLAIYPYGALVAMVLILLFMLHEVMPSVLRSKPAIARSFKFGLFLGIGAGLTWLFFSGAWASWLLLPVLLAYLHFVGNWAQQRIGQIRGIVATALSFAFLVGTVHALVAPSPLPQVSLNLRDGSTAAGGLVTNTGQTWLVATDSHVRSIPESRVVEAHVTSPPGAFDQQRSLFEVMADTLAR